MAAPALITEPPRFITQQNYDVLQTSTPQDFSQIPPRLKFMGKCRVKHTLALQGLSLPPPEGMSADVYVTEEVLAIFDPHAKIGFSIPFPYIALHATSKEEIHSSLSSENPPPENTSSSSTAEPCVYCQIESPQAQNSAEEPTDDAYLNIFADSEDECTRAYSSTQSPQSNQSDEITGPIQNLFYALSHCASLHPPDMDENEDGDDEDAFLDSGYNSDELTEAGRVARDYLEGRIEMNGFDNQVNQPDNDDDDDDNRREQTQHPNSHANGI